MTSKITQDSELLVAQNEATEFTIVLNIELEEAKLVISCELTISHFRVKKTKFLYVLPVRTKKMRMQNVVRAYFSKGVRPPFRKKI